MSETDDLYDKAKTIRCPYCGGRGEGDSGGFEPWGAPISIPCPDCHGEGEVCIRCNEPLAGCECHGKPPLNWSEECKRDRR